jgi:hypothetical protein
MIGEVISVRVSGTRDTTIVGRLEYYSVSGGEYIAKFQGIDVPNRFRSQSIDMITVFDE